MRFYPLEKLINLHDDYARLLQATEACCRALRTFDLVYAGNDIGVMLDT